MYDERADKLKKDQWKMFFDENNLEENPHYAGIAGEACTHRNTHTHTHTHTLSNEVPTILAPPRLQASCAHSVTHHIG